MALLLAFSVTACGNDDMGSAGPALSASSLSPASLPASSPAGAEGTTVTAMFVLLGREEDPDGTCSLTRTPARPSPWGARGMAGSLTGRTTPPGNILELTFGPDWSTAEIWPAIYYGLDGVTLLEEGDPADADQYADTVAMHYDPQPQEPPVLSLSWRETFEGSGLAVGTSATTFRCQYHYVDLEDQPGVTEIDLGDPMEQDIRELELEAPPRWSCPSTKQRGTGPWSAGPSATPPPRRRLWSSPRRTTPPPASAPPSRGWVYHLTVAPAEGGFLEYVFQA